MFVHWSCGTVQIMHNIYTTQFKEKRKVAKKNGKDKIEEDDPEKVHHIKISWCQKWVLFIAVQRSLQENGYKTVCGLPYQKEAAGRARTQ